MADFFPGSLYVDYPQTGIAVRRFQTDTNFLAPFIAPRQVVKKPSGLYTVWRMSDLNRDELKARGPSAAPATGAFNRDLATFTTDARSLAYDLNAAAQAGSDIDSDPETVIPMALGYKLLISAELRVASTFFVPGAWYRVVTGTGGAEAPGAEGSAAGTRRYVDDAALDPVTMIGDEIRRQGLLTGQDPIAMVFGRRFWHGLRNNPKVRAQLVTGTTPVIQQRPASLEQMAMLLELQWCGVSKAIYNTSLENEQPSNRLIIPADSALLYFAPGAGGKDVDAQLNVGVEQPSALARFVWEGVAMDGVQVRRFPDQNAGPGGSMRSVIDVYHGYGVVAKEMGTLFQSMVTPLS
ncbi:MAG: hypothetical protein E6J90_27205 [Deltaproteobacteria bacterium]|nr:MAG: hypothetical protein E6J90_27205 [Deltaproteobacteria bacterium]